MLHKKLRSSILRLPWELSPAPDGMSWQGGGAVGRTETRVGPCRASPGCPGRPGAVQAQGCAAVTSVTCCLWPQHTQCLSCLTSIIHGLGFPGRISNSALLSALRRGSSRFSLERCLVAIPAPRKSPSAGGEQQGLAQPLCHHRVLLGFVCRWLWWCFVFFFPLPPTALKINLPGEFLKILSFLWNDG